MKTVVVYFSLNGNTAWAAEKIAAALGAETLALAEQLTGDRAETARRIARELDRMKGWVTDGL